MQRLRTGSWRVAAAVFVGVVLLLFAVQFIHSSSTKPKPSVQFPQSVLSQIQGFRFYYPSNSFDSDYSLVAASVHYQDGVLIFLLQNPKHSDLAFSEEATPPHFPIASLSADVQFQTGYGSGYITDAATRTTGALFTTDNTWIIVNAPTPVGANFMQSLLTALKPS